MNVKMCYNIIILFKNDNMGEIFLTKGKYFIIFDCLTMLINSQRPNNPSRNPSCCTTSFFSGILHVLVSLFLILILSFLVLFFYSSSSLYCYFASFILDLFVFFLHLLPFFCEYSLISSITSHVCFCVSFFID